ncbi:hypothetical protein T8K17_11210 [Thalassobaculum sp. OXR-137]|uniref:hypothetical protein n=1 Tax=Thalassobaculum sp. OXR-137 TaxID=3100173 RepID=UPI002AC8AA7B|nr:hypothetical protein [Thalassobaculum sp. OXR-137]WPZ36703.1 hypothetical protein T8K17_11210 [Thalassobaculum sp. OXR-137]
MCLSAPSPPDTSAADAEANRQEQENRERERQERNEREEREQARLAQERADRLAWEEEQRRLQADQLRREEEAGQRIREQQDADIAAAEAQADRVSQYQTARGSREAELQAQINNAFSGYDDAYFQGFESDYLAYYNPVIAQNANEAKRSATLALAQNGNLQSSAATRRFGLLDEKLASEQARIAQEASDAAASYRSNILDRRRALLDQALSSTILGDPDLIPTDIGQTLSDLDRRVTAFTPQIEAGAAVDRPTFGEVGNAFLDVATTANTADPAGAEADAQASNFSSALKAPVSEGSLSVVGAQPEAQKKKAAAKPAASLYGVTAA